MISRCIAVLSLLALAGCCASGAGCTAGAPGGGVAWDGLGPAPQENASSENSAPAPSPSASRANRQTSARSQGSSGNEWEQQQASDQNADAKLSRQLKICSNC